MACEYCGQNGGHDPRCPNFEPVDPDFVCEICGNSILSGEEYIMNDYFERVHLDCIKGTRWLLDWLDATIFER